MVTFNDYLYRVKHVIPWANYPLHKEDRYQPFFIVGSGRSGNTLLRRILMEHPGIYIPPETYVLGPSIRTFSRNCGMEWKPLVYVTLSQFEYHPEFITFETTLRSLANELISLPRNERSLSKILDGFYRYHASVKAIPCSRWGDKTPLNTFYMDRIFSVFPDTRFINLIRDGVDVVNSYIKTGIYQRIEDAANRWKQSLQIASRFSQQHPGIVYDVRYEELVSNPQPVMQKVCDFLNLNFEPAMLVSNHHIENMGDVVMRGHHKEVYQPINASSIGKGKRDFTKEEMQTLYRLIGKELKALGYL